VGTPHAASALGVYDYAMFAYFAAYLAYAIHAFFSRKRIIGLTAALLLIVAWALHTVFFVDRAHFYYLQHQGFVLPATNMFEAVSFFCWLIVLVYLILEPLLLKTRLFGVFALLLPVAGMAYSAKEMSSDPRELMPSVRIGNAASTIL
jgi:ABC-type transport system involved in cytochrome c biogenesis permease subunit